MKIIYDVLGGDKAPLEIIKGAILAEEELGIEPILCGSLDLIDKTLNDLGKNLDEYTKLEANSNIENDEEPVMAIRKKKDSSIVVGMSYLAEGKADAIISAGSTGALLAAGIFILKRLDGVERSPIATLIPTKTKPFLLVDTGANVDVSPELINQFAIMGSVYMKEVIGVSNPEIALMNIGAEPGKGNNLSKEAYKLLESNLNINFKGNIEARDLPYGSVDVVVCDGFNGNIFLKSYEGTATMIKDLIVEQMATVENIEIINILKAILYKTFATFDYSDLGGAPLLGLTKPVIKAHGISDAKAILGASKQAKLFVENQVIKKIEENFRRE